MQTTTGGYRVLRLSVSQSVANYHDLVYTVVHKHVGLPASFGCRPNSGTLHYLVKVEKVTLWL